MWLVYSQNLRATSGQSDMSQVPGSWKESKNSMDVSSYVGCSQYPLL